MTNTQNRVSRIHRIFPGWFVLLTSLLSFWRVKRWERGILASSPSSSSSSTLPAPAAASSGPSATPTLFGRFSLLRSGLGFPVSDFPGADAASTRQSESDGRRTSRSLFHDDIFNVAEREDGELEEVHSARGTYVIPIDESDPERTHRLARAYADEARLQRDLRAAGLL